MSIYLAQIGQPLIIRRISDGERLLSEMLEMFNQPLSWWAARYLFGTTTLADFTFANLHMRILHLQILHLRIPKLM